MKLKYQGNSAQRIELVLLPEDELEVSDELGARLQRASRKLAVVGKAKAKATPASSVESSSKPKRRLGRKDTKK